MVFPYRPEVVEEAGTYFDSVVNQILAKDFALKKPPEYRVCKECDLRSYCSAGGIVKLKEQDLEVASPSSALPS